jgi:hypothetical protein
MVGSPHEALHRIFQEDTSLFTRTLQRVLGVTLPKPCAVSVLNTDVTEIRPLERRIDTVLLAQGEGGDQILIIEAQTDPADDKLANWPYYISYLHEKHRCPVTLLVICPKPATAIWARKPIEIGLPGRPCLVTRPFVLGPDNVPAITDAAQAREDVIFTVFSALTHGRSPQAAAILEVLAAALDTIDVGTAGYFAEFTEAGLGDTPARKIWRTLMAAQNYRYESQLRAEGRAEGEAKAVLRVLERRGIHVPSSVREQILACTDTTVLDGWLDRSLTITSIEDLFN